MADSNPLLETVTDLESLSSVLPNFTLRFNELQSHLDFIQQCIETRSKQLERPNAILDPRSELETLCKSMNAKGLRRFIISNPSEIQKIEEDARIALRSAPDPARLVLDCIGDFYVMGKRAYTIKEMNLYFVRQACIHVMELFLSSGANAGDSVRRDAEEAAIVWRDRIFSQRVFARANKHDALALFLFVSSFGVFSAFTGDQMYAIIRLSGLRETAGVRKKPPLLVERISDIIQGLVEKKMQVVAVAIAFAFGLEDRFPPVPLLKKFLHESKETTGGVRIGQGSGAAQREAFIKRLADLKLVLKCLEDHNLGIEFASHKVKDEVATLEKQINSVKRNEDEFDGVQRKGATTEGKRPCPSPSGALHASVGNGTGPSVEIGSGHMGPLAGVGDRLAGNGSGSYRWHGEGAFSKSMKGQGLLGPSFQETPGMLGSPSTGVHGLLGTSKGIGSGHMGPLAGVGDRLAGNGTGSYGWHGEGAFSKSMKGQGLLGSSFQETLGLLGPSSTGVHSLLGTSSAVGQSVVRTPPAVGQNLFGSGQPPLGQILDRTQRFGAADPFIYSSLEAGSSYDGSQFNSSAPPAYAPYLH